MAYSVESDLLTALQRTGVDSVVLNARLEYSETNLMLTHYIPKLRLARVHPRMLPTQSSGRWSTTNPPLVNFPADCLNPNCPRHGVFHIASGPPCWSLRDCIVPNVGEKWICWDWDAVEAKLVAIFCQDEDDLQAFEEGWDIHTITTCKMFKLPLPPNLKDPHKDPACAGWRGLVGWGGKDDRRRRLAKNCRYALAYGVDEKAMDRYSVEMQIPIAELRASGRLYLASKPGLVRWKQKTWARGVATRESRTFLGRRRRVLGDEHDAKKVLLNHKVQGSVADMMNYSLVQIDKEMDARLVLNTHDGAKIAFPRNVHPLSRIKEIVEREWSVEGYKTKFTATWGEVVAPEEA